MHLFDERFCRVWFLHLNLDLCFCTWSSLVFPTIMWQFVRDLDRLQLCLGKALHYWYSSFQFSSWIADPWKSKISIWRSHSNWCPWNYSGMRKPCTSCSDFIVTWLHFYFRVFILMYFVLWVVFLFPIVYNFAGVPVIVLCNCLSGWSEESNVTNALSYSLSRKSWLQTWWANFMWIIYYLK